MDACDVCQCTWAVGAARTASPTSTSVRECTVRKHGRGSEYGSWCSDSTTHRLDGSASRCLRCLKVHVDGWSSEDCNTDVDKRVRVHRVQTSTWIRMRSPLVREHHAPTGRVRESMPAVSASAQGRMEQQRLRHRRRRSVSSTPCALFDVDQHTSCLCVQVRRRLRAPRPDWTGP